MNKIKKHEETLQDRIGNLPLNIQRSKDISNKYKLVLSELYLMNNLDYTHENGYFFIDNEELINRSGVCKNTMLKALELFIELDFISRKKGQRGKASEYIIHKDKVQNYGSKSTNKVQNKVQFEVKVQNENELKSELKLKDMMLRIRELENKVQFLMNKVQNKVQFENELQIQKQETEIEKNIPDTSIQDTTVSYTINNIKRNVYTLDGEFENVDENDNIDIVDDTVEDETYTSNEDINITSSDITSNTTSGMNDFSFSSDSVDGNTTHEDTDTSNENKNITEKKMNKTNVKSPSDYGYIVKSENGKHYFIKGNVEIEYDGTIDEYNRILVDIANGNVITSSQETISSNNDKETGIFTAAAPAATNTDYTAIVNKQLNNIKQHNDIVFNSKITETATWIEFHNRVCCTIIKLKNKQAEGKDFDVEFINATEREQLNTQYKRLLGSVKAKLNLINSGDYPDSEKSLIWSYIKSNINTYGLYDFTAKYNDLLPSQNKAVSDVFKGQDKEVIMENVKVSENAIKTHFNASEYVEWCAENAKNHKSMEEMGNAAFEYLKKYEEFYIWSDYLLEYHIAKAVDYWIKNVAA